MTDRLAQLDPSVLQQCMHCGMCLPVCPTYAATRRERHSPRGRIALMAAVAASELPAAGAFAEEIDSCLGCLACQSACPAGVDYARLFETARAEAESSRRGTSPIRAGWRWFTLGFLFMRPRWLRLAGRVLALHQRSGLESAVRRFGLTRLLPSTLRRLEPQAPRIAARFSDQLIAPVESPPEGARHRVALLTGCVQDLVFPSINRDTADVLLANGCEVHTPSVQPCCGSLHAHNGEPGLAATLARRMIDLFPPHHFDAILTNAGGCGAHLRHYHALLGDDPAYAARAKAWDAKVADIHEWLVRIGFRSPTVPPAATPLTVTWHASCHLVHGQKVTAQPRQVLGAIPGLRVAELTESDWCCGSAGVYSITRPEFAGVLKERKVGHILATGAQVLATSNPGCHLQIATGLREAGSAVEILQPVTLLARAYRREPRGGVTRGGPCQSSSCILGIF